VTDVHFTGVPGDTDTVTSPAQDGLWYLSQMDSVAAVACLAYRVTGPLDLTALRDAWRVLAHRHDALRTTLPDHDGVPAQRISATPATELLVVEGTETSSPDRLVRAAMGAAARLDRGPLVRLTAVGLGPAEHLLMLAAHRAVVDDESMAILVTELSESYAAIVAGLRPELSPLPEQRYADFARKLRAKADGPESRRGLGWWAAALSPSAPPLDLPTDRPRPDGPSGRGGVLAFEWDGVGPAVTAMASAEGTTAEVVLLAAFQVLLHRLCGADRVSVGMPVSVRPNAGMVGAFDNLVVLDADFTDRPTFDEHLRRVAATAHAGRANADVPFDRVVRALRVDRDPRRLPLVDALLVHAARPELHLSGVRVAPVAVNDVAVTTDLALTVHSVDDSVAGSLAYRASLFDPASARGLLGQLRTLLGAALDHPELPTGELPLEDPATVRSVTVAADLTSAAGQATTVTERVRAYATAHPDAPAVVWDGAVVSYGDLVSEADKVTSALREHGPVDGKAVAVRLPQGPRQVAALLGVLDAGAHLVCLGTGDAGERGRAVLADLRPVSVLVAGTAATDDLAVWFRDELAGRIIDTDELTAPAAPVVPARARPDERAYVAYTSGSTGRPKGIPTTHASIAQFVGWLTEEFRVGPGSRVAQWAAAGYDASLVETFAALTAGATLCPVPDRIRAHPEKLVAWLAAQRITLFQTVPSFAREVLKAVVAEDAAGSLTAIDHLLLAGEALPGELANALRATLPSARLVNMYGPTETIIATWHEVGAEAAGTVPIGRSIPGRQVIVVDDHDRPCPTGVTGHLVVMSPHVTTGYTGTAADERAAFAAPREPAAHGIAPTRCYRTGDFGRRRSDGSLEFRGRRDLQVKFQGVRVELTDIETALADHESIAECAVTAVTNAEGLVTRLVAHVVPARDENGGARGTPKDWRAVLQARFGRTKYSMSFHTVLGLPRNLGGKVDRRKLPVPAPAPAGPASAPAGVNEKIAAVWSQVLGVEPTDADETFFAAGGHSLLVPVLLSRVREHVGVAVPLLDFLHDPTIAGLSAQSDSPTAVRAIPRTRNG
jgi:amino acid adenylation domain-containing protein